MGGGGGGEGEGVGGGGEEVIQCFLLLGWCVFEVLMGVGMDTRWWDLRCGKRKCIIAVRCLM